MAEDNTGWEDMFAVDNTKRIIIPEEEISRLDAQQAAKQRVKTAIDNAYLGNQLMPPEVVKEEYNKLVPLVFNRFGSCPNCGHNLDGGDIFEELCKCDVFSTYSNAGKMAVMYGWTPVNKKRYSNVTDHLIDGIVYHECVKCLHVFENKTSKEYKSIVALKVELFDTKPVEEVNEEEPPF